MWSKFTNSVSYLYTLTAFLCIFGGSLAGFFIQKYLPSHHLAKESQDSVKVGAGLIATMAALILGLLVSSSKGTFDRVNVLVNEAAADVITLDRSLAYLGPEAAPARVALREQVARVLTSVWPEDVRSAPGGSKAYLQQAQVTPFVKIISGLPTVDAASQEYKSSALGIAADLAAKRSLISVESTSRLPIPLVVIPIFWITFLTFVYGLFAPRNATVTLVLFFCAVSIAGAIYLICEMSTPLDGSIKIPSQPFRTALEMIGPA
jgi:hypothetical protein